MMTRDAVESYRGTKTDEHLPLVGPLPADEHDDEGIPPTMSICRNSIPDPNAEWF